MSINAPSLPIRCARHCFGHSLVHEFHDTPFLVSLFPLFWVSKGLGVTTSMWCMYFLSGQCVSLVLSWSGDSVEVSAHQLCWFEQSTTDVGIATWNYVNGVTLTCQSTLKLNLFTPFFVVVKLLFMSLLLLQLMCNPSYLSPKKKSFHCQSDL